MRRRKTREVVVQILYGMELCPQLLSRYRSPSDLYGYFSQFYRKEMIEEDFLKELFAGVLREYKSIRSTIEVQSKHWRFRRMPYVDRSILRVGVYELLHLKDIPVSVAINEAVELGHRLGDKDSPAFINGILDKVSKKTNTKLEKTAH